MKLGPELLKICEERGWKITRLARECRIPVQTIHGWTTGKKAANLEQIQKVANTLKVPLHDLIFGEPDPNSQPLSEEVLKELFTGDVRVTIHRILRK